MRHMTSDQAQSVLQIGGLEVRYYLREPSPDKWNAIGVISGRAVSESSDISPKSNWRMIVGVGPSRDEAIGDLISRVMSSYRPELPIARHAATLHDCFRRGL